MFFSSTGKSQIYIPSKPVELPLRKSTVGNGENQTINLRQFVEERCPSLYKEFRAPWWLFNGHLQTLYCVIGDFTKTDKVVYNRTLIKTYDGGTLSLDFTPTNFSDAKEDTPIIVVMHGLTGGTGFRGSCALPETDESNPGSYEQYVRSILYPACSPVEKGGLGYRGVVVNFRGCAGTPITSQQLYSAGYTDDIRTAVMYIQNKYPKAPLLGLGFSLGANVITRYFAEEGENNKMVAGCILGCPWDLERNTDAMNETFVGKYIYSKGMASNLSRLLQLHVPALTGASEPDPSVPPHHPSYKPDEAHGKLVAEATKTVISISSPTLEHFDGIFTRVAGARPPIVPFKSARHYYEWARSDKTLPGVRRPLLALNSGDDPVVQHVPWGDKEVCGEEGKDGYVIVVKTAGGGHLGWFTTFDDSISRIKADDSENNANPQISRWATEPVLQWFRGMIEDVAYRVEAKRYYEDPEAPGWIREEGGKVDVAYYVVEEGEGHVVDGSQPRKEQGMLQGL
ncbi:hypothetical protein VNI00_012738 [Paramarasmius palmivorus]|uniref:AB hydrolase-1 domain-containing protein n=1 Tax=Paramarasmius palmivorus TaxID=297713 RepID=A0AAW0C4M6_9AGAR